MPLTDWPSAADVNASLAAIGVMPRTGVSVDPVLAAVIEEIERETQRQFVADTGDTTRWFDGSGQSQQDVDDMVSLTSVSIVLYPGAEGYPLQNCHLVFEQGKPKSRISIRGGTVLYGQFGTQRAFPPGRQNIEVTGRFGYGATVPADLWLAARDQAAAILADEALFSPGTRTADEQYAGRLVEWSDDDTEERYQLLATDDGTRRTARFTAAIERYRRRQGRTPRQLRPVMS